MRYITLVNRSSKTLEGLWDGKIHILAPGKHSFPEAMAEKFKAQHPIMGTEDPFTLRKEYLLGVEDYGDDCSPIEQSVGIELVNRSLLPPSEQNVVVARVGGLYRDPSPQSAAGGFVNPN